MVTYFVFHAANSMYVWHYTMFFKVFLGDVRGRDSLYPFSCIHLSKSGNSLVKECYLYTDICSPIFP